MILILSVDHDLSSDRVCDWLEKMNASFLRLHPARLMNSLKCLEIGIEDHTGLISFDGLTLDISKIRVVWNRKWNYVRNERQFDDRIDVTNSMNIGNLANSDFKDLSSYIFCLLGHAHWLDHPKHSGITKLEQLVVAKNAGLLIPETIVTSKKSVLLDFKERVVNVITKPIGAGTYLFLNGSKYLAYTSMLSSGDYDKLPDKFALSLFQALVIKDFEVRVFFLDGMLYAMAIFSQNDQKTLVDFRNYNHDKPNRNVAIKLPADLENKIKQFMKSCGLRTGSLDLIKTKGGEYVFLEVNPCGQFGMVDVPCNYGIDRAIAEYLIRHDNEQPCE